MMNGLHYSEKGLTFASVHDSFWTHAGDIDTLQSTLRDEFIKVCYLTHPSLEPVTKVSILKSICFLLLLLYVNNSYILNHQIHWNNFMINCVCDTPRSSSHLHPNVVHSFLITFVDPNTSSHKMVASIRHHTHAPCGLPCPTITNQPTKSKHRPHHSH
jgi:hypothetical protein